MTQYAIDPATASLTDFTKRHGTGTTISLVDDGGTPAILLGAEAGDKFFSYDPVPAVADVEIVTRVRISAASTGNYCLALSRMDPTAFTLYGSGIRGSADTTIISYVSGAVAGISSATSGISTTSYLWQRHTFSGTTITQKTWAGTAADEGAAVVETITNSDITASGLVGIGVRAADIDSYFAWIGIGTGGDPAPTDMAASPTLTTTLVADSADTALPASVTANVRVFTATNALVGIGTITVPTSGAVSITDADLTLETGMSLADATTYRVDFQEASGTRQRTVELTAAV